MLRIHRFTPGMIWVANIRNPLASTIHARGARRPSINREARETRALVPFPREQGLFPVLLLLEKTSNNLPGKHPISCFGIGEGWSGRRLLLKGESPSVKGPGLTRQNLLQRRLLQRYDFLGFAFNLNRGPKIVPRRWFHVRERIEPGAFADAVEGIAGAPRSARRGSLSEHSTERWVRCMHVALAQVV